MLIFLSTTKDECIIYTSSQYRRTLNAVLSIIVANSLQGLLFSNLSLSPNIDQEFLMTLSGDIKSEYPSALSIACPPKKESVSVYYSYDHVRRTLQRFIDAVL